MRRSARCTAGASDERRDAEQVQRVLPDHVGDHAVLLRTDVAARRMPVVLIQVVDALQLCAQRCVGILGRHMLDAQAEDQHEDVNAMHENVVILQSSRNATCPLRI